MLFKTLLICMFSHLIIAQTPLDIMWDETTQMPNEMIGIASYPFNNPSQMLQVSGVMLGLFATDYSTTKYGVQNILNPLLDIDYPHINLIDKFSPPENILMAGLGGLYLGSVLSNNEQGQRAVWMSLKAFFYSYSVSHVTLKTLIGRQRPSSRLGSGQTSDTKTDDSWDFLMRMKFIGKVKNMALRFHHFI